MKRRNEGRLARRGSTLVTVVILLGTMTVLTLVFLRVGQRVTDEQLATVDATRATYLAEAGISEAVEAMRSGQSGNIGSDGTPAYLGGGVVWVEATDLGDGRTQLDSMAMKDGARTALRVVVEGAGGGGNDGDSANDPFLEMLFANKKLDLALNCSIDSWDSSLGPYTLQATNLKDGFLYAGSEGGVAGNEDIALGNGVHVFGDAQPGPGFSVAMGTGSYVSGSKTPGTEVVTLPPVTVPVVPLGASYSVAASTTKTLASGTYHFKDVTINKLGKLVVKGPATIVMDAFTTLSNATMELDCKDGPITIYDTGKWATGQNFTLAPALGSPVDACVMVTKGTVKFAQGSKIYAGFYCPQATITIDTGAEIWGALIADMVNIANYTKFHFDKNLMNFPLPWDRPDEGGDEGGEVTVLSWSEIQFPIAAFRHDRRNPFTLLGVERQELRSPVEAWEDADPYQ